MIRSVRLVCAECGSEFVPEGGVLYYKDNYINNTVKEAKFICPACIKKWHEKWQIKNAGFNEVDYVMTVTIELEDGTVYEETYGGEKYEDVAFRVNIKGVMETAVPVPDYILKQIIDAYSIYELQNRE